MSVRQVYFTQECQICGRPMRVRIELFGQRIRCAHCNASCHAGQQRRTAGPVVSRAIRGPFDADGLSAPVLV